MEAVEGTFYFKHRQRILEERKRPYTCTFCGKIGTFGNKSKHEKTFYCIISNINNKKEQPIL